MVSGVSNEFVWTLALREVKLWKDSSWDCVQLSLRSPVASRHFCKARKRCYRRRVLGTSKHVHAGDCLAIVFHQKMAFFWQLWPSCGQGPCGPSYACIWTRDFEICLIQPQIFIDSACLNHFLPLKISRFNDRPLVILVVQTVPSQANAPKAKVGRCLVVPQLSRGFSQRWWKPMEQESDLLIDVDFPHLCKRLQEANHIYIYIHNNIY